MPLGGAPARMTVTNLVTDETAEVQFNPTEFEHLLEAEWIRLTIPGLSHQPLHYSHTSNATFPMELFYRVVNRADRDKVADLLKFFESLMYPVASDTVASASPPRVLFVWPQFASLTCVVKTLGTRFVRFAEKGRPVVIRQRVGLEEIRDVRLLSSTVRLLGLQRSNVKGEEIF